MEENEEDKTNQNDSKHNGSCLVNIINEIVDCATCQSVLPSTSSSLPEQNNSFQTSPPIEQRLIVSRPSEATRNNYYVHNTPLGHYKSEGIIVDNKSEISKSFTQIPPSYSTVIKLPPLVNNNRNRINIHPSISFISRQPPPSYQEVHGSFQESLSRSTISCKNKTYVIAFKNLYCENTYKKMFSSAIVVNTYCFSLISLYS